MPPLIDISGIDTILRSALNTITPARADPPLAYWLAIGLVVGGVLIIVAVIVGLLRGRSRVDGFARSGPATSASAGKDLPPEGATSLATVQEAERLLRLMGDAEELCARLSGELDAKARELQSLLDRAESIRAAPLQRPLPDRHAESGAAPDQLADDDLRGMPVRAAGLVSRPPIPESPSAQSAGAPSERAPTIVTRPLDALNPVPARAVTAPDTQHDARGGPTGDGLDALARQVYTLADRGLPAQDIARTLREHPGKIELILALRSR